MRIEGSTVSMSAKHQKIEQYQKEERLEFWVGNRPGNVQEQNSLPSIVTDLLEISEEGKKKLEESLMQQASAIGEEVPELDTPEKQKLLILQAIIEKITGKKFKFVMPKRIKLEQEQLAKQKQAMGNGGMPSQGWGIAYDLRESFYQKETMSFVADGVVRTADGREITFSVQLNMTREFAYQQQISFRAGDAVAVDPLVIHFDTFTPELTERKYEFDLDADGMVDSISFVGSGSGFLAIDLNGDGIINDGTELFGPRTGNGFAELAAFDEDKNGWIDENDSIYERLLIWTKDSNGQDRLFALGEKGIGAIYLGNVNSPFDLKDSDNRSLGQVARTGIFLRENGTAGIIQHIDLVV